MPISSNLTEQLAVMGIQQPAWPEEPNGDGTADGWIQRGKAYAEGLQLWRAQLRNATERTKRLANDLLRDMQETGQMGDWVQIVYGTISLEGHDSPNDEHWRDCSHAIQSYTLTAAQLLGIALEMARQQQLEAALRVIQRLFNEHPGLDKVEHLLLLSELFEAINTTQLIDDARTSQESLGRALALHEQMAGLLLAAANDTTNESLSGSDSDICHFSSKLDAIIDWQRCRPREVDRVTWGELLMNAKSTSDPRSPDLLMIESRSLPRSGHHFLKNLLSKACGDNFSYCEGYQETGCCEESPCGVASYWHHARAHHIPHTRLVKSHDFQLKDTIYPEPTGLIRLIQIRRPIDLLASWLELMQLELNRDLLKASNISASRILQYHESQLIEDAWQLIDKRGIIMKDSDAKDWLQKRSNYVKAFLKKWMPKGKPFPFGEAVTRGSFLLCYEDLDRGIEILKSLGKHGNNVPELPRFHHRKSDVMNRRSERVSDLIRSQVDLLRDLDTVIIRDTPELGNIY